MALPSAIKGPYASGRDWAAIEKNLAKEAEEKKEGDEKEKADENKEKVSTLSLVTMGHRDIFDINVPVIFLKF